MATSSCDALNTVVTAAPPTPNGDLHLGHISGPYAGADIFTRARRLTGHRAELLLGSDIHQSYLAEKARELGSDAGAVAARFEDEIEQLFRRLDLSNRQLVRPAESQLHVAMVQDFFLRLHETGKVRARDLPSLYCDKCELHLVDAYLTGTCPHCGNDDCDGNLCEMCAWPNSCVDLIEPRCNFCGAAPRRSTLRRLVFPLGEHADALRDFLRRAVLSPQLEALCHGLLDHGLPDIAVTQPMAWGVPVTVPGFEHQRYFVWAEMAPGYLASLAESLRLRGRHPEEWRREWGQSDVVQFFGWDNSYFHALLFPALMAAYDPGLRLPTALLANEFYQLDDLKFSTSRQHAIWGSDMLSAVPADVCRFVLALDRPEHRPTSFSLDRFHAVANDELAGRWQTWLGGVVTRAAAADARPAPLSPAHARFLRGLEALAADCLRSYAVEHFSTGRAARALIELVARAGDFTETQRRGRTSATAAGLRLRASTLTAETAAARLLAQLSAPIMPEFGATLWAALGERGEPVYDEIKPPPFERAVAPDRPFFAVLQVAADDVRPSRPKAKAAVAG
jgi:methionyl-tRNA synthetase